MAWEGASGRREQNHHRYIRMEALSEMMLVQKQGEEAEKTFCSLRQKPGSVSESSGLASVATYSVCHGHFNLHQMTLLDKTFNNIII